MFFSVPPNGLVVYCGTIVTEEGKEKKVNIDFEPFKPINTSLYLCDNKFHTEVRHSSTKYVHRSRKATHIHWQSLSIPLVTTSLSALGNR